MDIDGILPALYTRRCNNGSPARTSFLELVSITRVGLHAQLAFDSSQCSAGLVRSGINLILGLRQHYLSLKAVTANVLGFFDQGRAFSMEEAMFVEERKVKRMATA